MASTPTWLIGKHVTAITIIGQTVSSTGDLTASEDWSLVSLLDEINPTSTNDTENIVPLDVRQNNEVIVGSGSSLTLVEILNQNLANPGDSGSPSAGNVLVQVSMRYDIVQVTFSRSGFVYSGYFTVGDYSEGIRRGKSVGTLQVKPCGIGLSYGDS